MQTTHTSVDDLQNIWAKTGGTNHLYISRKQHYKNGKKSSSKKGSCMGSSYILTQNRRGCTWWKPAQSAAFDHTQLIKGELGSTVP